MISLLVPSRGRPEGITRLVQSLREVGYNTVDNVEIIVRIDDDDPAPYPTPPLSGLRRLLIQSGPRLTLSDYWNECWAHATGDIAMLCADDIVFRTPFVERVEETFSEAWRTGLDLRDRIAYLHGDDGGPNAGTIGTHGFVHRRWIETVGYFTPSGFPADYADLWLTDVANAIGRRVYLPGVVTEHMHPGHGKAPMDATYQEKIDRAATMDLPALYDARIGERMVAAEKLRRAMG